MSDQELLEELVTEVVDLLVAVAPHEASLGPFLALRAEHHRRQRRYRQEHGSECACWVCYRPLPLGIHPDDEGPF